MPAYIVYIDTAFGDICSNGLAGQFEIRYIDELLGRDL